MTKARVNNVLPAAIETDSRVRNRLKAQNGLLTLILFRRSDVNNLIHYYFPLSYFRLSAGIGLFYRKPFRKLAERSERNNFRTGRTGDFFRAVKLVNHAIVQVVDAAKLYVQEITSIFRVLRIVLDIILAVFPSDPHGIIKRDRKHISCLFAGHIDRIVFHVFFSPFQLFGFP